MKNSRITYKDMNNIKGGLRKAFARSELYAQARAKYRIEHHDPTRPRCKKWSYCAICGEVIPEWRTALDHIDPLVPIHSHFEDMPINESVNRLWCELANLQVLCLLCHERKTSVEKTLRKPYNKPRNKSVKKRNNVK